jgi:hypothetical protein
LLITARSVSTPANHCASNLNIDQLRKERVSRFAAFTLFVADSLRAIFIRLSAALDFPLKVTSAAFRISSESDGSSAARAKVSAPTNPARVASAFSRRAALEPPGAIFANIATIDRMPSVNVWRNAPR